MAEAETVRYRLCTVYFPGHIMYKLDKKAKPGVSKVRYSLYKFTEEEANKKALEWKEENGGVGAHCAAWIEAKRIA